MQTSEDNIKITEQFISLEKIIASKNKNLLRFIPKPLLNAFKKFICLNRINEIIYKYRDCKGVDFADAVLKELNITLQITNPDNIPSQGRPIIVANHPIGSVDGMGLISTMGRYRRDILFPVNDILCQLPGLRNVFVPINKYGRNTENHNALNNAFEGGSAVCFFPAGTESKIIDGKLQDFAWKKTFITKAQQFRRNIVPVYIEGGNSKAFYRFSKVRRFFGIKFDLEMIMLPRELFKQAGKSIKLTFGKAIPYTELDKRYNALQWADKIRTYVYQLQSDNNAVFSA
ncbi:MAG: 1-acyl-sn-glycerol-3-phosphate acyltransferase [Bacteroidales bacterium]|nr:1-acyl-sn-glycerol-3-phosphate acyltransferase [Bacteroidales bacterium]